jgi:hypothetical protein
MKPASRLFKLSTFALVTLAASGALAQKGETVKIAWIDPLSGLMAAGGAKPAQELPVPGRRVQQKEPCRRQI